MAQRDKTKVGELRPSQIMYAFGVGAVMDLSYLSVMVMGIDEWPVDPGIAPRISEERLLRAVKSVLGDQVRSLIHPPAVPESAGMPDPFSEEERIGVPVVSFPRWMVCSACRILAPLANTVFERKDDYYHPERTRYVHKNCQRAKSPFVFPARFMVACENGHLDDFPWHEFVHAGPSTCRGTLRLREFGPSGEARDVHVSCDTCHRSRALSLAFGRSGERTMPQCRGRRPHLRDYEECELQAKAILLGASNLWFADVLTTLAIPTHSARLAQLVDDNWAQQMQHVTTREVLFAFRQAGTLGAFSGYQDDEIWAAIQQRREEDDAALDPGDLKGPEWDVFTHPASSGSSDDFRLREVAIPDSYTDVIERVVLAERLREVRALIGFMRIDAPGEYGEEVNGGGGRRMRLSSQDANWVPATEVRGEGVFIQFQEEAIRNWCLQQSVVGRGGQFFDSHVRWRRARRIEPPEANYPGMRYILLHSFAHALMRRLCLECGYTAASIRERIYSREPSAADGRSQEPMAGLLIYTAAPDSEGTLGGLVHLGEPEELGRHIRAALEDAALCASDPLCAEHDPSQQGVTLHAAACHACLFSPETSCERGNRYLDRSVLVPTVDRDDLAFFDVVP